MKDSVSIHKSVQEMCDCFATTDPLQEMSKIKNDSGNKDAAVKWLALAALHGVNQNAEKISIFRGEDGRVKVLAEYRVAELPSPGSETGEKVFEALREMTHIETDKVKTALALGIRDSSLDLNVTIKKKKDHERITIQFPNGTR
jgi:hypothetical protein